MSAALNIVSFSRGILCGCVAFKEKGSSAWTECKGAPVTMPANPHAIEIDASKTAAVFVLEKVCEISRTKNDSILAEFLSVT